VLLKSHEWATVIPGVWALSGALGDELQPRFNRAATAFTATDG
jgi:hypothetical protein